MAGNPAALRLPLGHLLIYGTQTALICLGSALLITLGVCGGRALGSSEVLFEFTGVHLDKLGAEALENRGGGGVMDTQV